MLHLTEAETSALVDEGLALEAARVAFTAVGSVFPVVVGHTSTPGQRFTLKSGTTGTTTGVKIGTYWLGNDELGLPRHNSTIILLDPDTGHLAAVIEAASANALRTAAADALAVQTLAREDSTELTVVGTGHQAYYEATAVARVRPLSRITVTGRDSGKARALADRLHARLGVPTEAAEVRVAVERADIIVTATASREPLFAADWVRAGTHISAMGADGPGKQELPPDLLTQAALFCDVLDQAQTIGEFKHAAADAHITELGDVLRGAEGRTTHEQVTVFDSSGFALQDLALAQAILAAHSAGGSA